MKPKSNIFCQLRKSWVLETPEEKVRQKLIHYMTYHLNYPFSTLCVEKGLVSMPHISDPKDLPERRADLVCFSPHIHPEHALYPLLLVECKAIALNEKAISQIIGYNYYVKAYYVALVNDDEIRTGWFDSTKGQYVFVNDMPSYNTLLALTKKTG